MNYFKREIDEKERKKEIKTLLLEFETAPKENVAQNFQVVKLAGFLSYIVKFVVQGSKVAWST